MKVKLIKKADSTLTKLLTEKEGYHPSFLKDDKRNYLDNIPLSIPKAFILANLSCKKFKIKKIPEIRFIIVSTEKYPDGFAFRDVNKIFLTRHSVHSFLTTLSAFVSPNNMECVYNKLLCMWKEKESENWKLN
uniref:Uncharacterized protein n=2 Tax=viral metagenome TaxID=1070528 RepID=A0A6H1ZTL1_9ZZZZ